ncbi:MAG: hypothetical protein ACK4GQ_03380 [Candidatus Hadarchaeales archaeon]
MRPVGRIEEVYCPKCTRYVGTLEKCPYCRAKVPKRLSFRILKWGGLAVAVLGIMFLYVDVRTTHILVGGPYGIRVADLYLDNAATLNFAQVVVTGKATFVKYYEDTKFLGMFINDLENENASVFVRAYDATTKFLLKLENERLNAGESDPKFPALGDIVTLRGNLRVRASGEEVAQFRMLIVQYPEGFIEIYRPEAIQATIEQIALHPENFPQYSRLMVTGKIIGKSDLGWAVVLTLLEPETNAELNVMLPKVLWQFGDLQAGIGDVVNVKGAIQMYYTTPQLWVASWDDLQVVK